MRAALVAVGVLAVAGLAVAAPAHADREVHGGLEVRTDLRTHALRIPAGLRLGAIDVTVVVDPLVTLDGQHDGDVIVAWHPCRGELAWFGGWRTSAVAVADVHHWQQRTVLGLTAPLGRWRGLRARFGAETAILWVSHGAGLPANWIALDRSIVDHVRVGMFVRVEYATRR